MAEITNEMVEAAAEAYWLEVYGRHRKSRKWPDDVHGGSEELFRSGCRAALTAAENAREAPVVMVKPLEWANSNRSGSYVAHGAGVMYAADQDHDCVILAKWEGSSVLKSAHATMEVAKAFAQEGYEKDILSALSTPPQQDDLRKAWKSKWSIFPPKTQEEIDRNPIYQKVSKDLKPLWDAVTNSKGDSE